MRTNRIGAAPPIFGSFIIFGLFAALSFLSACSGTEVSGNARLDILIEPEDVIQDGIAAGEQGATIRDGWSASFEKYIVGLGDIEISLPSPSAEADAHEVYTVDLMKVPAQGEVLWTIDKLRDGRWNFGYSTLSDGAIRHSSVSEADHELMLENDYTYLIEGSISKSDGISCPPDELADIPDTAVAAGTNDFGHACYENPRVEFVLGVEAETEYGPCEIDGLPGVAVAGSSSTVAITIHGDHIFFNGFPTGSEANVARRAQWLADCDLNLDGVVTTEELSQIEVSEVIDPELFQLGNPPIPLDNMLSYVKAQLKTQGHYQGEGECPVDGMEHDHSHDHDHDHD